MWDRYLITLLKNIGVTSMEIKSDKTVNNVRKMPKNYMFKTFFSKIFVYNLTLGINNTVGDMKNNKILLAIMLSLAIFLSSSCQYSNAASTGEIYKGKISIDYRNVTVFAPAVATTDSGYIGVISTITVTIQGNGSGRVFVDTLPLTQIDMQGSARLAVKVASAFVKRDNISTNHYDFFFVVRTSAPIIGGPSAGAVMTLATVSLLENWTIDGDTVMTGMINPDGSIGPIGGITHKIDAAYSVGATRFLIPNGQGTYTEMVTKTISEDGGVRSVTQPVTQNVADYAMDNYGIEVVEVADINDVLLYFTGYNFSSSDYSNGKITTEDYIDSMKPLASTLIDESKMSYENASDLFDNSSIPNHYPFYYENQLTDFFNAAEDRLIESEDWYEHGLYYSSTSKSFQSLINSRFVVYACEYFNSEYEHDYIKSLFDDVESFSENKSIEAKNADIDGVISLQCVGAAQKRVSEADYYISGASSSYTNKDYLTTLYKLAFAMERSRSVGWWLGIASHFNDTGEINTSVLENLAVEYIEDAEQAAVYSNVILKQVGSVSSYLEEAEELLDYANSDLDKDYFAAALFEALEALVKANLAIETIDGVTEEKIERARESASNRISESRNIGIEPVLAVSYYEYAESLVNESSFNSAIVYYKYSGIIAGSLDLTNFSTSSHSSRFIGIPKIQTPNWGDGFFKYFEYQLIMLILGGIAGLGIGLIIGSFSTKKTKKEKYSYDNWVPRSIEDYYKKHK